MKKKKAPEAQERPKKLRLWVVLIVIAVLLMIIAGIVRYATDDEFHYEGTIDCMPPLSASEAELCERAEKAGYPNIVY